MKKNTRKKSSVVIAEEYPENEIPVGYTFTIKQLKERIKNLDDNMIVCTHRIEDYYFKYSGWKTFKVVWEKNSLTPEQIIKLEEELESQEDKSLVKIEKYENGYGKMYSLVDGIPCFSGFVTKDKYGREIFLMTPHY